MNVVARWIVFFILLFSPTCLSLAQTIKPVAKPAAQFIHQPEYTLTTIREKIDVVKNNNNIEEALKQRILNAYYAAETNLEELLSLEQQIQVAQEQLKNLPAEIKQLEKRIDETEIQLKKQKYEEIRFESYDDLEQRLINEKSNLNELKSSINQLELKIAEQLKQPQQIREQIAEIKKAQADAQKEQAALDIQIKNKQQLIARKVQLESYISKLSATLNKLNLEKIIYPLSLEAQQLELQLLNLQSMQFSDFIKYLDKLLTEQQQREIEQARAALIQAQKEAASKHPVIQAATRENIRYSQLLQEANKKLEHYDDKKEEIEALYKQLEKDFQSAEQKINLAGLSPSLGNILREQRRNLPLTKNFQSVFNTIQEEIALTNLELFQLDELKRYLLDMEQVVQSRMSAYTSDGLDEAEQSKILAELRSLLNNQKELVTKLSSVYSEYSRTLADLDFSLQQLVTLGEKFNDYLSERLLWVPSAPVINKYYLIETFESILWFSQVAHWQQLLTDIKHSVRINPILTIMGFLIIALQFWLRKTIKIRLETLLIKASKLYTDRFEFTFYGLGYAFLLALPFSMLLALPAWLLLMNEQSAPFSHLVADGLMKAAMPLLIIQFFYLLFKPKGLAQTLFDWQEHNINLIHGQLKWVRFVVIPAVFIIGMLSDEIGSEHSYTLGRMALIIAMLSLSYVLHRFASPVTGLGKEFYQVNPNSWISRFRYIWYGTLVLTPLAITGFAIAGYYQSALELQSKLIILLRLIFFAMLLHQIVMRWLILTNRQLALQNARQKRKLQEQTEAKDKTGIAAINPEEELLLDIPKINEQNKKLLKAVIIAILAISCWLTLRDILPALSIFEQVVLWQQNILVDGQETLQPVTLVNVFTCLLYVVLMLVFVKNFPGLIDLFFVGRYRMTSGSRYAAIQLVRYAVITVTVIAVANELGGSWSQVQWLVAAIGVGLGFGLQEIFANMVSGIILLFERPIRVGDTVTVGDISGKVTRIQMRATTIIDWDQKELIVPNKSFITDKLINWTLTDSVTRIVIPVGIAYVADEELALRVMKQVIEETPLILKEPEPSVLFMGFGESSLDFSVRVFVRNMDDRLTTIDTLHRKIRQAFKAHNIEIPFPQRDLHIRSSVLANEQV